MSYKDHLRSDSVDLELGEVLRADPTVLLGVDAGAAHALGVLGIRSVADLARSATFGAAATVLGAVTGTAEGPGDGHLPGDLFTTPPTGPIETVPDLEVTALRLVGNAEDGGVGESLDVRTIRDLALWPPYLAARDIAGQAPAGRPVDGDGPPADLLPGSGQYPVERAYYSTFALYDGDDPTGGTRVALEDAGALDPMTAVVGAGFSRPIRGARLTFAQSWYAQGVALGQLLHSLALAPGESTRLAMIDWSRQQSARQQDTAGQTEMLNGETTQKRAMSEVQNAVAAEAQNGFSQNASSAQQAQGGGGGGFSAGGLTVGGSGSTASNSATSDTVTGSSGVRNLAAAMTQHIADSTHQAASSARNMYASVVRELSQAEHESISTRVVANFNHMHALTLQYYEVVQIYRTSVRLHRFDPCLFVPMRTIDFLAPADGGEPPGDVLIRRYRTALQAAALDTQTRDLLEAAAAPAVHTIEIRPNLQFAAPPPDPDGTGTGPGRAVNTGDGYVFQVPAGTTLEWVKATFPAGRVGLFVAPVSADQSPFLGLDAETGPDQPFESHRSPPLPVPVERLTAVGVQVQNAVNGFLTLGLAYRGAPLEIRVPALAFGQAGTYGEQILTVHRQDPWEILRRRLAEDRLHYSQVVWRAMDSATVAVLLAPYSYGGRPLAQVVDPAPIGVSGNLLVFRMPWEARDAQGPLAPPTGNADDPAHAAWLDWVGRHADYDSSVEDFVPLPSGGVFAEGVLGRANSAEKLDITRFWNWQDSPVPLQAPDIAAIQAGSRAQQDATTTTGPVAPVVAFNNPAPLPDPAGLSGTLAALASGSLFRDMSGSATSQALALAALTGAGQGATDAGAQGVANAAAAAQKDVEMAKIAAGIVTGGLAGGGTVSEKGAKINEGKSLDERNGAAPTADGKADSHEAQAAEGDSGAALRLIGSLARPSASSSASSASSGKLPTKTPST
jgi:hypothetical protein